MSKESERFGASLIKFPPCEKNPPWRDATENGRLLENRIERAYHIVLFLNDRYISCINFDISRRNEYSHVVEDLCN